MKFHRKMATGLALFLLLSAAPGWVEQAGGSVKVDEKAIRSLVETYIREKTPWKGRDLRFEYPAEIDGVVLPAERYTCRIQPQTGSSFMGDSAFYVRFYEDQVLLDERRVRLRIEVLLDVVVSARRLDRNREIGEGDIHTVRKWFRRAPLQLLSREDEVAGKKLSVTVGPNAEIRRNMLREVHLVRKGKPVQVLLEDGPIHLSTLGICQEDGTEGALIRVQNVSSKKIIYAWVIGESLVKVEF